MEITPFTRYLLAKRSVDDRALNRVVWQALLETLPVASQEAPLRVLEVGSGVGTMVARMLGWGLLTHARVTAVDADLASGAFARQWLPDWARRHGHQVADDSPPTFAIEHPRGRLDVTCETADALTYVSGRRATGTRGWDLLVAHAFLDLVDLPSALPGLVGALAEGGLFYFSLNFDGVTILEPEIDPAFDALVIDNYHRTMDTRRAGGQPAGDSRTGRHLFAALTAIGCQVLAAGSSDWVVYPGSGGYPQDEAYFLHFIIDTIHLALDGHPEIETRRLAAWVEQRHAQIESHELLYIAHQIDLLGRR